MSPEYKPGWNLNTDFTNTVNFKHESEFKHWNKTETFPVFQSNRRVKNRKIWVLIPLFGIIFASSKFTVSNIHFVLCVSNPIKASFLPHCWFYKRFSELFPINNIHQFVLYNILLNMFPIFILLYIFSRHVYNTNSNSKINIILWSLKKYCLGVRLDSYFLRQKELSSCHRFEISFYLQLDDLYK